MLLSLQLPAMLRDHPSLITIKNQFFVFLLCTFSLSVSAQLPPVFNPVSGYSTFIAEKLDAPPVAQDDNYTVVEGETLNIPAVEGVLVNDTDEDGDILTAAESSEPSHATAFHLNDDGSFTYQHDGTQSNHDVFTYNAEDAISSSNIATVNITVENVNDQPQISPIDDQTINKGESFQPISLNDLVYDEEDSDQSLMWSYSGNDELSVSIDEASHVANIESQNSKWVGAETITFKVTDSGNAFDTEDATFTIKSVNSVPVATDDEYSVNEGQTITVDALEGVIANDTYDDLVGLTAAIVTEPAFDSYFHFNGDGSFTYTHNGNETGDDVFTYSLTDESGTSNTATVTIKVLAVNDAPVLNEISPAEINYTENASAVKISGSVLVTDVDDSYLESATVAITGGFQKSQDVLATTNGVGISGSYDPDNGVLLLTGTATKSSYQSTLRNVTYLNTSDKPTGATRNIDIFVSDAGPENSKSNVLNKTVNIISVNDVPVVSGLESTTLNYTEGSGAVPVTATITLTDADNTTLTQANIQVASNYQNGQDVLAFTNANGISGSWNASSGTLTLSGESSVDNYIAALRSVTYENTSSTPMTSLRSISFSVFDGSATSNTVFRSLSITDVNSAPVLSDGSSSSISFTEGGGTVQLTNTISIADDDANMNSATVTITNVQNTEDILTFTPTGFGVSGSYNTTTGVLTITGSTSKANYTTMLKSVRYNNASEDPTTTSRSIAFRVVDALGNPSNDLTKTVTITAVNDNPSLAAIEATTLPFTEGGSAVTITGTLTVTDIDNPNLASALVKISSNYTSDQDVLSFTNSNGITGAWNATTGELTLSGNVSFTNYQNALRTVKYNNTSVNPNTAQRTISFTVNDGLLNSNTATRNISITATDNSPVLTDGVVTPVTFTEGGTPVRVTNTITITDDDNTTLASAKVAITSGLKKTQDVLQFTLTGGITGSYNATSGELNLSGTSSLANYQSVLRSVLYNNTEMQNPDTTDRIISYTVNDGTSGSNTINKTVLVKGVNDPPVASAVAITASNDKVGTLNTGTFTFTDPEGDGEGTHLYKWYRSDNVSGEPASAITGATSTIYRPKRADGGKYIAFEVTPVDEHNLAGTAVKSSFRYINATPVASSVYISATDTKPGSIIEAKYTYSDKETNPQGTSLIYWFRSNSATPTPASPGTAIGNQSTYQLKSADAGKYIWFRVHPVATIGSTPGDSVWSNVIGPVGDFTANIAGSDTFCAGTVMPVTLTVTSGTAPYAAILRRSLSTSNKDTTISNILTSPRIINVKISGTYTLTKLTDNTGDSAKITGTAVKLVVNPKTKVKLLGGTSICNDGHSLAPLSLDFQSGVNPWTVTIRRNDNPSLDTLLENITADPKYFNGRVIGGGTSTLYRIVSVTDANGCSGEAVAGFDTTRVSYRSNPIAEISGVDTVCLGLKGMVKVTLKAGTSPWSIKYQLNGSGLFSIPKIVGSDTLLPLSTGVYTLAEVKDATGNVGCVSGTGIIRVYTLPTAAISGSINICQHTTGNLTVALTGRPQWKYSYKFNGGTPVEVSNVGSSPNSLPVTQAGTYTLYEVYDQNCKGTVSGSGVVTVTPAPVVTLTGLEPAYNIKSFDIDTLIGTPPGGTFAGPGVYGFIFIPRLAPVGTHNITYAYRASPSSCYGYDTVSVSILEADAIINFEKNRTKFCQNDQPFQITGVNLKGKVGTFSISGGHGLYNLGSNTALIKPAELEVNKYTITYTYVVDGAPLSVTKDFDVGRKINTAFTWATECYHAGQSIRFVNQTESPFGYLTDTSFIWIVPVINGFVTDTIKDLEYTFSEPGNYNVKLVAQNTYGCVDTLSKNITLRPTNVLTDNYIETFEDTPLYWTSSSQTAVNSWRLGSPNASANGFTGPYDGLKCWYTNISSVPAPTEQSYVTSPCYDFTGMTKPMLAMHVWRIFNSNRDGANVQATIDSAKTWMDIGELHDGIDWYNSYDIRGNPGNSKLGWSNNGLTWNDTKWAEVKHSLDMLKGKSEVQFRIAYGSADAAQNNEGIAFDNFSILERTRMALVERFTNSNVAKCAEVDERLDDIIQNYQTNMIDIQYHTSSPSGDPFYEFNPVIPTTRQFYYGISGVPYTIIDGGTKAENRFDTTFNKNAGVIESLSEAKFNITINSDITENVLNVQAEIEARNNISELMELSVRVAVIEREVHNITGANGDTSFRNVVRTMIPGAAGTTVSKRWSANEKFEAGGEWEVPSGVDVNELRIVAFIQNENTREVYQAAISTIGNQTGTYNPPVDPQKMTFLVYPNPSSQIAKVRFNDVLKEPVLMQLFNNTGSLIYSVEVPVGSDHAEIPVDEYPQGLYLLRFSCKYKILSTSKIIISR